MRPVSSTRQTSAPSGAMRRGEGTSMASDRTTIFEHPFELHRVGGRGSGSALSGGVTAGPRRVRGIRTAACPAGSG